MKYYNKFDFYNQNYCIHGYLIQHFKTFKQEKDNTCGPCCLKMVLNYLGNKKTEKELAILCKTKPYPLGTKLKGMVNCLNKLGYCVYSSIEAKRDEKGLCFSSYNDFINFVTENLKNSRPIIVENVDWGGHYKIIIGLDMQSSKLEQDMLIFADPYEDIEKGSYNYFSAEKFYDMWFDDHCLEKKYRKQPFIVIKK